MYILHCPYVRVYIDQYEPGLLGWTALFPPPQGQDRRLRERSQVLHRLQVTQQSQAQARHRRTLQHRRQGQEISTGTSS